MALLEERQGRRFDGLHRHNAVVCVIFALLYGGGAAASTFAALRYDLGWLAGTVIGAAAAAFMLWGLYDALRSLGAWRRPVWATVKEITESRPKGGGSAEVVLDDAPDTTKRIGFKQGEIVDRGMRALVVRTGRDVRWLR
jgi:hypothetical protein